MPEPSGPQMSEPSGPQMDTFKKGVKNQVLKNGYFNSFKEEVKAFEDNLLLHSIFNIKDVRHGANISYPKGA